MNDLHSCVEKSDTTRVLELLKQGEHLILINQPNSNGVYPLHVAAKVGNVQIAEILIQNNAKGGCLDQYGLTPLHYAARSGNKDVLIYLLKQKGTQVDCQEKGFWTPLHYATYYKHTDLVKILCEYKASVDETNVESKTALHLACEAGYKEIIEILMAFGASVNMTDREGKTPLELLNLKNHELPVNNGGYSKGSLEALSKDLKSFLLKKEEYSDISFQFGEQIIPAHQNIIHARAPYFLERLKADEPKDEEKPNVIKPANTSFGAFKLLLEWIYTANIEIEEVDLDIAMELYTKSDLYKLPNLKVFIEGVINSNLDCSTAKALFEVALSSNATTIIETCANFIAKNYGKILKHSQNAAVEDSNAMDVENGPGFQNKKNLFSTEALSEISSRLNIIQGPAHVLKDDSVPVSQESFIKPALPAKSEIKNSLPAANNNNKKNIPQQPTKPAPQNTNKSVQPNNKPLPKEEPSDIISIKNIELVKKLVQDLFDTEYAIEFREPVSKDYTYYYDTIPRPMDLGTIKKNLVLAGNRKKYKTIQEVAADVRLTFNNARTFNLNDSPIYECAEILIQKFEDAYSALKAKLNFPKSFDPPVKFIPPPVNLPAPIECLPTASTPVASQNRKKKISPEAGKQEDNTKKRKVERKSEATPVPKNMARPAVAEEASQTEVEQLTSDLSKILHIQEVALEIIKIAYGDHGSDEEYELDISTLPSPAIRKLQQFVKDFKIKNPDHNFEDEKISEDD